MSGVEVPYVPAAQEAQAPTIAHGARGAREATRRVQSVTSLAEELADASIEDVLKPDVFTVDDTGSSAWLEECTGLSDIVRDETGRVIDWPWESPKQQHTGGKRRRHRLDALIMQGLMHSTASGDMGANSTGVRKATKQTLLGQYSNRVGDSVRKCVEDARGGVLFIDEVYALSRGEEGMGQEAVDALVPLISSTNDVLFIIAGYHAETMEFMDTNRTPAPPPPPSPLSQSPPL